MHLDYISCLLTVVSTILVGRRLWQGWILAGVNSLIVCVIGLKTAQIGFIPANIFCLAIYGYNMVNWRAQGRANSSSGASDKVTQMPARSSVSWDLSRQVRGLAIVHEGSLGRSH